MSIHPQVYTIHNISELRDLGRKLLDKGWNKFALYGDLGAGKTAFVKEMASLLGVDSPVQSPTFALLFEYNMPNFNLYHFDFYRLSNAELIWDLGFEEYWEVNAYQFIEWPEMIKDDLPADFNHIHFEDLRNGSRKVTVGKLINE